MRAALASLLLVFAPALAFAATQSVTEDASYALGDNDTRAQARDICLAKVERKALEASGSLVESEMDMISAEKGNGAVSDSAQAHVRSYVGAVVKASAVKDNFHLDGERLVVDCSATVTFNPDEVRDRLRVVGQDKTTKAEVDQQQQRIAALETQVQDLSLKLAMQSQAQALIQTQQQSHFLTPEQQAQIRSQAEQQQAQEQSQAQAYAQGQALTQIQRQAQGVAPPPRPYANAPLSPYPPSPLYQSPPRPPAFASASGEPPPPAAQPRFQVEVAPLAGAPGSAPRVAVPSQAVSVPVATPLYPPPPRPVGPAPRPQLASLGNDNAPPRARSIRAGMSAPDLIRMIGRPRASVLEYNHAYSWNYGDLWVTINNGLVQCVSVHQNPTCRWAVAYQ